MVWPTLGWRTAEEQNIDRHLDIHDDYMERLPTILTRRYRPNFPQVGPMWTLLWTHSELPSANNNSN